MKYSPHNYQTYATDFILEHPISAVFLDMGYSIQHIYRLHDWALREFPIPQET